MKLLKILGTLLLIAVIISFCSSGDKKTETTAPVASAPATPSFNCEAGAPASGAIVDVKGSGHVLRTLPDAKAPKVPNEKASSFTKKPEFHSIDSSEQVQVQCVSGDWSKIQVTQPDYLNYVTGWVQSKVLALPRAAGEARTYTAEDIHWDKDTGKHKDMIVKAVNRIVREDPRCKDHIDVSSIYKSTQKSMPNKSIYFVPCGSGMNAVNVYFSEADVSSAKQFTAPGHIVRGQAVNACEQYAKQHATHPSTVDFSRIMDLAVTDHPNGRTTVMSSFTAKNAFNLELKFKIRCLFDENGLIEANVNEETN